MRIIGWLLAILSSIGVVGAVAGLGLVYYLNRDLPDFTQLQDYEPAVVTETTIREWAWALFVAEQGEDLRTIRRQDKTLAQLCPKGKKWCKAGVEFFGDYGKRIPDSPVPLPAAFYLFAIGLAGLFTFSRQRKAA